MKINLKGNSIFQFNSLIDTLTTNIYNSSSFVTLLSSKDRFLLSNKKRKLTLDECKKAIDDYLLDGEEPSFNLGYSLIKLKKEDYISNPYYRNIKLDEIKEKDIAFKKITLKPYEPFVIKDVTSNERYEENTHLGYFEEEFSYMSLTQNKVIWMSLSPYEIETMKEDIANAKGNVLTYGLGLGYFPYMCSLKDDVDSITIVEKDENIVLFFKKYILPQFKNKDKIKIVIDDAFNYKYEDQFDYIFIDIYHNEDDGLIPFIKFKQKNNPLYRFWIEGTFITMLKRYLIDLIDIYINEDFETLKYLQKENEIYRILDEITKDITFSSYLDIHNFIKDDNIKNLFSN